MTTSIDKITESIITKLQDISLDKQKQILEYIESIAEQRVFGLHKGKIWISDDFNDPLPDKFWDFDS